MPNSNQQEAETILSHLASIPFEDCIVLSKEFRDLPMNAGIYAVRHRTQGILYIGKTRTLRDRFRSGHKALLWAFIEALQATLESLIIQAVDPPYNVRIPARD